MISPKRGPRRCTWCSSLEHTDRDDKQGVAVCPGRRQWREEMAIEDRRDEIRRRAIAGKVCDTCGREPAQVKLLLDGGRSSWLGESCARFFEDLSRALGGNPHREPLAVPDLRVVR